MVLCSSYAGFLWFLKRFLFNSCVIFFFLEDMGIVGEVLVRYLCDKSDSNKFKEFLFFVGYCSKCFLCNNLFIMFVCNYLFIVI